MIVVCLNASTYVAEGAGAARVHRGHILYDVPAMARAAAQSVHALCKAWGQARTAIVPVPELVPIEQVIPGYWRHLLLARADARNPTSV